MKFSNEKFYLFENEEILQELRNEYHTYYITKGFRFNYLYQQSTLPINEQYNYKLVATGKKAIEKYIKENNLEEVK